MALGKHNTSIKDFDGEPSSFGFRTEELTAINHDPLTAKMTTLKDAILEVTLGRDYQDAWGNINQYAPSKPPADEPNSQREIKWLVEMVDTTTYKPLTMELPCADLENYAAQGVEYVPLDLGNEMTDLVQAIEAVVVSNAGNPVEVTGIKHVGRNL